MLHPLPGQTFLGFAWGDGIHRSTEVALSGELAPASFLDVNWRVERDGDMGEVAAGRLT